MTVQNNPLVLKIRRGTMKGTVNLCASCRYSKRTTAAMSNKTTVTCLYSQPLVMKEPLAECSVYSDKNTPSLYDMEQIAWSVITDKGGKKVGFHPPNNESSLGKIGGFS